MRWCPGSSTTRPMASRSVDSYCTAIRCWQPGWQITWERTGSRICRRSRGLKCMRTIISPSRNLWTSSIRIRCVWQTTFWSITVWKWIPALFSTYRWRDCTSTRDSSSTSCMWCTYTMRSRIIPIWSFTREPSFSAQRRQRAIRMRSWRSSWSMRWPMWSTMTSP